MNYCPKNTSNNIPGQRTTHFHSHSWWHRCQGQFLSLLSLLKFVFLEIPSSSGPTRYLQAGSLSLSQRWAIWDVQGSMPLGHKNGQRALGYVSSCNMYRHWFKDNTSILPASSTVWQHHGLYSLLLRFGSSTEKPQLLSWRPHSPSAPGRELKASHSLFHLILVTCVVNNHPHFQSEKTGTGSQ